MKKIAVFDLDHTLIDGNASYFFGKYLYKKGELSLKDTLTAIYFYSLHKMGWLSLIALHEKIFSKIFAGRPQLFFSNRAVEFVGECKAYFYEAVKELEALQAEGHETLLLSSSPDFIVRPFAEALKFTSWGGTVYQDDEKGLFSKVSSVMDGEKKAACLASYLLNQENRYESSAAYSDSLLDLPLLQSVTEPIAVNPDAGLLKIAKASGWRIIANSGGKNER